MIGIADRVLSPFVPLPWHVQPWRDKSPVLLLTGSAGGGKSRLAAEKVHAYLLKYPGATGLMLRKAREFANKSIAPFMRHTVIGNDPRVQFLKGDFMFQYENGSVLYWGGMKDDSQREAIRSIGKDGALDCVWMEEANAFTLADFEELLTRIRGKAAPWRQVILTTNPDAPNHWINQRLIVGKQASVYYSGAKDNPHNPPEYLDTLNQLTGIRFDRLVKGLWVQAEGAIFDNFSLELNVTDDAEYDPRLDVYWGVDDGYAYGGGPGTAGYHPRVVLLGQLTPQGGMNIFCEYVKTGVASYQETIAEVLELPYKRPQSAYIDSSAAMFAGALWEADIYTIPSTHLVAEGIKNLRRLICDGKGVRLFKIHSRCVNLIRELQSYRYDDKSALASVGEPKPLKLDDHCIDSGRYLCWPLHSPM